MAVIAGALVREDRFAALGLVGIELLAADLQDELGDVRDLGVVQRIFFVWRESRHHGKILVFHVCRVVLLLRRQILDRRYPGIVEGIVGETRPVVASHAIGLADEQLQPEDLFPRKERIALRLGTGGKVALYNSAGNTQLVADVAGWFASPSELTSVGPARLLDTRPGMLTVDGQAQGGGALGPAVTLNLQITGRAGIPNSGVGTAVLNVTAVTPTAPGYLTIWGAGDARPNASNLNFTPGMIIPNLVFAKVGSGGQVSIYNNAGSTHVVADVVGWMP